MKKFISLVLALMLILLSCQAVFAAEPESVSGIYEFSPSLNGITLKVQKADKTVITKTRKYGSYTVYGDTVRIELDYEGIGVSEGDYLMVFALAVDDPQESENVYPTADNIEYIDQQTVGSEGKGSFNIYPKSLESGTTYYIYLSSNHEGFGYKKIASYSYYSNSSIGDLNADSTVNSKDAMIILYDVVGKPKIAEADVPSADVDGDGDISITDALCVLQYSVGRIGSFAEFSAN